MNFKEEYRKYNENICPDKCLVEQMKEEVLLQKEEKRSRATRVLRDAAVAVAACLCILIGIPTLAANIDPIYSIIYRFSPKVAQRFRLVQTWDEKQGIRMEVAAVFVEGNELQAYITLQDLEEDRIDGTTDLCNSYSILAPVSGYGGGGYAPVEFEEETGKATFLITLGQLDQDIQGDKVSLFLKKIRGRKQEYHELDVPIPWSEVQMDPETMEIWINGAGYPNTSNAAPEMWSRKCYDEDGNFIEETPRRYTNMLLPGEPDERLSVEGIDFTGMGYIDGVLRIQTAVYDNLNNDNHCELFLKDKEGNLRMYDYKISGHGEKNEKGISITYQECAFAVTPEELENYTLCGHFVVSGFQLEGNWSVTFPLK